MSAADSQARRAARAAAIQQFASQFLGGPNQDLYEEMLVTVCRLANDEASRGDVKLIRKALAELRYALKVFSPYETIRKITIYGSARTPEDHPNYLSAVEFARQMREHGWMVITGAGDGIMKAGHGGAGREASFGVAIRLPFEQKTNDIIANDSKLVNFRYFFTRKLMFMKEASSVALFPGGFGTHDELFEALTLIQTGKSLVIPVVMCEQPGGTYWQRWKEYVEAELLENELINPEDRNLYFTTHDPAEAVAHVLRFYRVYHSSRFVGDELVLRLSRPISPTTLEQINDTYAAKILAAGKIVATEPLPEEADEFPELPRLRLAFNRRSIGHLRGVIDLLNADGEAA